MTFEGECLESLSPWKLFTITMVVLYLQKLLEIRSLDFILIFGKVSSSPAFSFQEDT